MSLFDIVAVMLSVAAVFGFLNTRYLKLEPSVGLLMISRIPTWSLKRVRISRENVKYFLVGFAFFGAAILSYAWITLVVLCLVYAGTIAWSLLNWKRADRAGPR